MLGTVSNIYVNKVKRHLNRIYIVLCMSAISLIGCTDVLFFYLNVKIRTMNQWRAVTSETNYAKTRS